MIVTSSLILLALAHLPPHIDIYLINDRSKNIRTEHGRWNGSRQTKNRRPSISHSFFLETRIFSERDDATRNTRTPSSCGPHVRRRGVCSASWLPPSFACDPAFRPSWTPHSPSSPVSKKNTTSRHRLHLRFRDRTQGRLRQSSYGLRGQQAQGRQRFEFGLWAAADARDCEPRHLRRFATHKTHERTARDRWGAAQEENISQWPTTARTTTRMRCRRTYTRDPAALHSAPRRIEMQDGCGRANRRSFVQTRRA